MTKASFTEKSLILTKFTNGHGILNPKFPFLTKIILWLNGNSWILTWFRDGDCILIIPLIPYLGIKFVKSEGLKNFEKFRKEGSIRYSKFISFIQITTLRLFVCIHVYSWILQLCHSNRSLLDHVITWSTDTLTSNAISYSYHSLLVIMGL